MRAVDADLIENFPSRARRRCCYLVHNPRVTCAPAPDGTYHQHHCAEVSIYLVEPFLDRARERRTMKDGKDDVEIVKITIYQVEHEIHFGKLKG